MLGFHLLRTSSLRHLRRQWVRAFLSLLGIMLGVASFIFTPSITLSLTEASRRTVDDLIGVADWEVRASGEGFDLAWLDVIRATEGVQIAAPLVTGAGVVTGQEELLILLGVDPAVDAQVRRYTLDEGRFIAGEGEALLSATYADELGIGVGERFTLASSGGLRDVTLVGTLADAPGVARINSGDIALLSLADTFALNGDARLDSVAVVGGDAVRGRLQAALPESALVDVPAARNTAQEEFNQMTNILIGMISLMMLGLGSALIYNAMAISITQRRAEIGVWRALGVGRGGVMRLFLIEAGVLGLIGSLVGIGLGFFMLSAAQNVTVVPPSASNITSAVEIRTPGWLPPLALVFGVGVSLLAGFFPARAASRVDIIETLTAIPGEAKRLRLNYRRLAVGLVLLALGLLLIMTAEHSPEGMLISGGGVYLMIAAWMLLFTPLLLLLTPRLTPVLGRVFGLPGVIAAGNLAHRPGRLIASGVLMMLAVWMYITSSGANFGYEEFFAEWEAGENVWDLTVVGMGQSAFRPDISIPVAVQDSIQSRPEVAATVRERYSRFESGGVAYTVRALDVAAFQAGGGRFLWNDGDESTAYTRLLDSRRPAVLIGGMEAAQTEIGSTITLDTPVGQTEFEVIGWVLGGGQSDQNLIIMNLDLYQAVWGDTRIDRMLLQLTPESDAQAVRRDLLREVAPYGINVADEAELRADFVRNFASITNVSRILSSLIGVILVSGLGSTLFILVLDRRREIGMLRAVGLLPGQVIRAVLLEAALLVGLALLIGVPSGALTVTQNSSILHESLGIRYPGVEGMQVAYTVLLVLGTSLLAAYIPAWRAGRTDILNAMRYE